MSKSSLLRSTATGQIIGEKNPVHKYRRTPTGEEHTGNKLDYTMSRRTCLMYQKGRLPSTSNPNPGFE